MRHKSNEHSVGQVSNILIPEQQPFQFKPRFSKHKNFYAKQSNFELHYITPTQQYAKNILDKICHVDKKALVNDRPESSFQKRKHFSVGLCYSSRPSIQKKQIRIKQIPHPNIQSNFSFNLKICDKDWLAFVLD
ncbi:unnamed protein product [Paramecium sonneborni]|uniref:Uncharacterized protein n=1 Tax=Paramecium sonneborni TaxID=65129 RepID=A0A8S1RKJ2_9CILI|nr:unnamed protein product [Paramecium sonneborni]